MNSNSIDAALAVRMFLAGARNLESKKEWVNELNVFPVPDGDTGTNMTLTIMSAADELRGLENPGMETVAKVISSGSLRGARGNSGVILSQLFRGWSKVCRNVKEIDTQVSCDAFQKAVETAYKAVMKPKEGTILTVARAGAEKARELFDADPEIPMEDFLTGTIAYMEETLNKTPEMLPVLKEAGVVDSGGQGLLQIMKGCLNAYLGLDEEEDEEEEAAAEAYAYRVECVMTPPARMNAEACRNLIGRLEMTGGKASLAREGDALRVHVLTNEPGEVLSAAVRCGALSKVSVENEEERKGRAAGLFTEEELAHADDILHEAEPEENAAAESTEMKPIGFIAVTIGDGLSEIFRELGADCLIEGGQTMNPSTQDILNAIDEVHAETIFILPNNKNIILAAEQAQKLTAEKKIVVIPTTTIPQGITALINFLPEKSAEENEETMRGVILSVQTVEVTYAVRDTHIENREIHAGDLMGVGDHGILAVSRDLTQTVIESLQAMVREDSELISVYRGRDVSEEDADAMAGRIQEAFPDCEVEMNPGGQPIYYYILSVE